MPNNTYTIKTLKHCKSSKIGDCNYYWDDNCNDKKA